MKKIEFIIIISFLLILTFVNCYWIVKNTTPPGWDDADYLAASESIYQSANINLESLLKASVHVLQRRPPLIAYATLPIYLIFGSSSFQIALIENLLWLFLFYIFFYLLIKDKFNQKVAVMSLLITTTMPLFYGLLRHFFVEFGLMTITVIWVYFLYKTEHLTNKKYLLILGFITGLGILMKLTFPFYISGFLFLEALQFFRRKPKLPEFFVSLVFFLIPALIAVPWYANNLLVVLWHAKRSLDPFVLQQYYYGSPFALRVFFLTTLDIINYVITWYYFGFALVLILWVIIKKRIKGSSYLLISTFPPTFFSIFSPNKDYRLLLPIVPLFGLTIAYLLWKQFKEKSLFYFPIILLLPTFIFLNVSVPSLFVIKKFSIGPVLIIDNRIGLYSYRPDSTYWPTEEIVKFINNISPNNRKRTVLTTSEIKEFNINNLRYYAIKNESNLNFKSIAYSGITYSNAMTAIKDADYILELNPPDRNFQQKNLDVYKDITLKINWEKIDNSFNFPGNYKLVIYKNSQF